MKRILALITALLFSALLLAGCTAHPESQTPENTRIPIAERTLNPMTFPPDAGKLPDDFGKKEGAPLYWDAADTAYYSHNVGASWQVCRSYAELGKKYGKLPEDIAARYTEESFSSMFVVAVSVTVPTGGYKVSLNTASINAGRVEIDVLNEGPKPGTMTTQALETHTVFVAFDSKLYSDSLTYNVTVNGQPAEPGAAMS